MATNLLSFCDFEEQEYQIIAVHTVLQDYKLAYLLNKELGFCFKRTQSDLDYMIEGQKAVFSLFEYQDTKKLVDWYLINNKFTAKVFETNTLSLFQEEESFTSSYVFLQPEVKEADFILKIEGDILSSKLKEILQQINKLNGVLTTYLVDTHKLNHKEHLIF